MRFDEFLYNKIRKIHSLKEKAFCIFIAQAFGRNHFEMEDFMEELISYNVFTSTLGNNIPSAIAWINGNEGYQELKGLVKFFETPLGGIIVNAEIYGLPDKKSSNFFGMHIHEFGDCTIPFNKTGNHYNPQNTMHPQHAGDMPPLLSNNGFAWTAFYDMRFTIEDIIHKSIVIHGMRDDFTSQPSGDSGMKIGCGVIARVQVEREWS